MDDTARIRETTDKVALGVDKFTQAIERRIAHCEALTSQITAEFEQNITYRIEQHTGTLVHTVTLLHLSANYHITRATIHASPEIMTLILTMVTIVKIITWVATVVGVIKIIAVAWKINQFLLQLFPRYRDWWNNLMGKISELSAELGWGADGVMHLLQAANMGVNIVGGLLGKDRSLIQVQMMENSISVSRQVASLFHILARDPAKYMNSLFEIPVLKTGWDVGNWWDKTSGLIAKGTDMAQTALTGTVSVINELQAIQNNMPRFVRENIPTWIWDGLAKADELIYDKILPELAKVDRNLAFVNNLMDDTRKRAQELAAKLAMPGDVLLGVDELPEWLRLAQEAHIDEVASREFQRTANTNRIALQPALDEFDRIDQLMSVPTPEPEFLTLENPGVKTYRGITVEPQETWFVGEY